MNLKIGSVSYINALPLTSTLDTNITLGTPRELSLMMENGELDVALLPYFSSLQNDYHVYPEAGLIGCDGDVASVAFYAEENTHTPEDATEFYFDEESRTSVHLAKIILAEHFGRNLNSLNELPLSESSKSEMKMLIGDKALFFNEPHHVKWDLGQLWKELTGCGFAFATWASRHPLSSEQIETLMNARINGMKNLNLVLENVKPSQKQLVETYLKKNIVYELTPEIEKGMKLYQEFLVKYGFLTTPSQIAL
jgi:predicted solute-binding protein